MPIGSTVIYNAGDLILQTVSSSGNTFQENKISAATSSLILFNSSALLTSQSLNSILIGSSSYVSGSNGLISVLSASTISASAITGSLFGSSSYASTASVTTNGFNQGGNSFGATATLGTNDANSLVFETNNVTQLTINSGGRFGIGTTPSNTSKLSIVDTHLTSEGSSSLNITTTQSQSVANSANDIGLNCAYTVGGFASSITQNNALYAAINISASGSYSGSYRAMRSGIVINNTSSLHTAGALYNINCTNQIGVSMPNFSIPQMYGGVATLLEEQVPNTNTGSINTFYHFYSASPFSGTTGSGSIVVSNAYGIFIAAQKTANIVTNAYGVYQIGTTDNNIFRGPTTFGSSTVAGSAVGIASNATIGASYISQVAPTNGLLIQGNVAIGQTVSNNKLDVSGNISASAITASVITASFSGSLFGTSSYALTASFFSGSISNAVNATSASYASTASVALTASFFSGSISNAISASFATTASYILSASYATTASYANTSSYSISASYAPGGGLSGGVTNYLPVWSGASSLITSSIFKSGSNYAINDTNFTPIAPEALLISSSNYNIMSGYAYVAGYAQINVKNVNSGALASGDIVVTGDGGNENGHFVNLGINSSGYTPSTNVGGAFDAYLYHTGSDFYVGNLTSNKKLFLFSGNTNTASAVITSIGNMGIGTVSPVNKLDIVGNLSASVITASVITASFSGSHFGTSSTISNTNLRTYRFEIGVSSTSTITTGAKGVKTIPYAGTITGWKLVADPSTTMTIDIWKTNNAIPTVANTITAATKPSLTAAQLNNSTTLTGWTTTVAANDVFKINVDANSAATYFSLELDILLNN
jgi:hypothetical protein